jgi:carbon starvation protein
LGAQYRMKQLSNKWVATLIAAGSCAVLAIGLDRGAGGMRLWPLFGTTNQLTAGLSLLVITIYLLGLKRKVWSTAIPMVVLLLMTTWAMIDNLSRYWADRSGLLLAVGGVIFVLELWLVLEAALVLRRVGRKG